MGKFYGLRESRVLAVHRSLRRAAVGKGVCTPLGKAAERRIAHGTRAHAMRVQLPPEIGTQPVLQPVVRHGLKLFLETGRGISRSSDAFDCTATPAAPGRMQRVKPEIWFPDSDRLSQFRLSEQSVRLVKVGQTLTLLWVQAREDYEG